MCQPKSKGGKRCLKHAKLSQFMTRYVKVRTGARDELISESMGELNREAKANNVTHVSGREVNTFIDKQSLAVDVDQNIGSHDRKIMQNQLTAAREENRNGADGNHFYVWKNLLGRVRAKMRKTVLALGLTGTLVIGISGCAAGINPQPSASPRPSSSISATTPPTPVNLGEAVGTGKIITDSHGSYETTKLNSSDAAYKYDAKIVDSTATDRFSKADVLSAQKFVVDFVTTEGVDSVALDNDTAGWQQWQQQNADKYLLTAYAKDLLADKKNGDRSGLIFNDSKNQTPVLARDGKPRIESETLKLDKVDGFSASGFKGIGVYGVDTVEYRVTKAEAIKNILANNPGLTDAQLRKTYPKLYDAKAPNPILKGTFNFTIRITKVEGAWKIGGYENDRQFLFTNLK